MGSADVRWRGPGTHRRGEDVTALAAGLSMAITGSYFLPLRYPQSPRDSLRALRLDKEKGVPIS